MKKVIIVLIIVVMVLSMGAWTYGSGSSVEAENYLRSIGFIRSEDDDTIWTCNIVDYDSSDFDYVIVNGTFWSEENILVMNVIGVDTYRNLTVVIYTGVGQWSPENEFEEPWVEWEHSDYSC